MNLRMFRYEVPVDDQPHRIVLTSMPVGAGCRRLDVVEFWAFNDADAEGRVRTFQVFGTGQPLPANLISHWGVVIAPGGELVWHLIEVKS